MLYNANGSFLYYKDDKYGSTNDYYQNVVNLIKTILQNNPELNVNIILCDNYNFNNSNNTLTININYEHTLVKSSGRSISYGTPYGNIADDTNEIYLVRIDNYDVLNNSDIIIDYSNPNIYNVKSCPKYVNFSKKHIYISSSIYQPYFIKENRNIIALTTFINVHEPRRTELLINIRKNHIEHINVNNCFEQNALQYILKTTKILINIHQTQHHHTFEELRTLPALECGVIVISEKSPLIETIPYGDLIIWVNYDDIIEKIKEVLNNYDYFYNKIFSIENIQRLYNFKKLNYDVLQNAIVEKQQFIPVKI
jgi:hypothetical protein